MTTAAKTNLKQWAEAEQPCNKMMQMGNQFLTDAELLAILVGSGTQKQNAVEVARSILANFNNNLAELSKAEPFQLRDIDGVGGKTICKIMAAFELGRRRQRVEMGTNPSIRSAKDIYQLMRPKMQDLKVEEFHVCFLNYNFKLLKEVKISQGGLTETAVDMRLIFKEAVICNATCIALAHNHPSGNLRPSKYDDTLTLNIKKACELMRIKLIDHVIVSDNDYYSYGEMGKL